MLTTGHTCAARGRRRTWRAARQAAEQVRDGNRVGETWREEKERLKTGERGEERQHRQSNEATLHLILHVSQQQHQLHQQQQHQQHQQQQQHQQHPQQQQHKQQQPQQAVVQHGIRPCILCLLLDRGLLAHLPNFVVWLAALEIHEYVRQPLVNVVDWTVKEAVTPVKNREQCVSR